MLKTLFDALFRRIVPGIPCGNTWETLDGDDKQRHCDTCDRTVHNLASLSTAQLQRLQAESPGRLCVVSEKPAGKRFSSLYFLKAASALLFLLMLNQPALARKEPAKSCAFLVVSPMARPPGEKCLDESGKTVLFDDWWKKNFLPKLKK